MSIEASDNPEEFNAFEHDGWESVSQGYEQHFSRLTSQSVNALLDAAGVDDGMRVLDVCTGPGMIAAAALERGATVTGLDFSAGQIEIARRRVPQAEFVEGDAQNLPYDDDSFDAVVCGYGIIHVPDPQRALQQMVRVAKPGARVATSVWVEPHPSNGFGLLFGTIKAHADMNVPLPHGPDFFQFSSVEKLSQALSAVGLGEPVVTEVEQFWALEEPMSMVNSFMQGAVRARGLLLAQTDEVRQSVFDAIAHGMAQFESDYGGYRVPMPALIGSGTK